MLFYNMNRKHFLKESSWAIAAACLSCTACTWKKMESPQALVNATLFTIDLATQLIAVGDSMVNKNMLVVRLSTDNRTDAFTAVQRDCTHAGGWLEWNPLKQQFVCPVHGSEFNAAGVVTMGPAVNPLQRFKLLLENNLLTIST
jgi:cytochrome b6-f complex iron-sulfur subunit